MKVGIGTYSFGGIESYLGLGDTLEQKFARISSLGFKQVELLPVDLEYDVKDIIRWRDEYGLEITSLHAPATEEVVEKMAELGGKAVILANTLFCNKAEAEEVAEELSRQAEMAKPYGIKIGYHNHNHEFYFKEGKTLLEHLLDAGNDFYAQLDCGWAQFGGMYPPSFIRKYRNRIVAIHVKENCKVIGPQDCPASRHSEQPDMTAAFIGIKEKPIEERLAILEAFNAQLASQQELFDPQCRMGAAESNIDWKEIKAALDEQDFEAFWIVERENFYADHDLCLKEDCAWLMENIK